MDPRRDRRLQQLPKIDVLVAEAGAEEANPPPRWALTRAARSAVEAARTAILAGGAELPTPAQVAAAARELARPRLREVINATGVVLHTGLGRAPLAHEVWDEARVAAGYCNLEFDLGTGQRGSRHHLVAELVAELCGTEDACVVNNNAGAVLLTLAGLAADREVVVSRGELVEIGGSFRVPEVMAMSGARLVEVGTTNKTRIGDYRAAIGGDTAVLLKVHPSNFEMLGFVEDVTPAELACLGRERGVTTVMDLGSGVLCDAVTRERLGLSGEAGVADTVAAGIDVVCFSGDKLLGGPQAGIIAGRRERITAIRKHPLMRALRPDKITLALLAATLERYRRGQGETLPGLALLQQGADEVLARAQALVERVGSAASLGLEVVACDSTVGAGAKPTARLPSHGLRIAGVPATAALASLRAHEPPVIGRIVDDAVVLDLRCVADHQLDAVASALRSLQGCGA